MAVLHCLPSTSSCSAGAGAGAAPGKVEVEEDSNVENLSTHLQKVQWGSQCLYDSDQWMKKHVQKYCQYQQDMEEAEQQQYTLGLGMLAGEFEQQ